MDKTIQKYMEDSSKAEFQEFVNENLPTCYRAIVIFEIRRDNIEECVFAGKQHGFSQAYELSGFITENQFLFDTADETMGEE